MIRLPVSSNKNKPSNPLEIEKLKDYMSDCQPWQDLCSFFDDEQKKIDEEFKRMNLSGIGGLHG